VANQESSRGITRDEIVSLLQAALLFFALLVGRELGDIYSTHHEVSQLSLGFVVEEEEIAGFIRDVLAGDDAALEVGLAFTLSQMRGVGEPVTKMPDYVRRWFISVTLSAIVVQQPEISEVEVNMYVEGEPVLTATFPFEREKVPYLRLLKRTMALHIEDPERFREIVQEASELYGGEVEFTFNGEALAHNLFLRAWLPFSTTSYPLVRAPHLDYLSSNWTNTEGQNIRRISAGRDVYVSVQLWNPTRVHSIWENVTVAVISEGSDVTIQKIQKEVGVAPTTEATYVFRLSLEEPGLYRYSLEAPEGLSVGLEESPPLVVEPG